MEDINKKHELFFHHEFIDDEQFSEEKKSILKNDRGTYYISDDFTIYQIKQHPKSFINKEDFNKNRATFTRILYHLPSHKVASYIRYHFDKYHGNKKFFIDYVINEFSGSRLRQGDKELPDPQQKLIMLDWLEKKRNKGFKHWIKKSENLKWVIGFLITIGLFIIGYWLQSIKLK